MQMQNAILSEMPIKITNLPGTTQSEQSVKKRLVPPAVGVGFHSLEYAVSRKP